MQPVEERNRLFSESETLRIQKRNRSAWGNVFWVLPSSKHLHNSEGPGQFQQEMAFTCPEHKPFSRNCSP